jgi:Zn-dependent protease with chaperone function
MMQMWSVRLLLLSAQLFCSVSLAQEAACGGLSAYRAQVAGEEWAQVDVLRRKHGSFAVSARMEDLFERVLAPAKGRFADRFIGWRLAGYGAQQINAFALGAGTIMISRGLDSGHLESKAIAAAIAHEVAHVLLDHGIARVCRKVELEAPALSSLASLVGLKGWPQHVRVQLAELMRAQELAADELAIELLRTAGFPPDSMSSLVQALAKSQGGARGPGAVHPGITLRLQHAIHIESAH